MAESKYHINGDGKHMPCEAKIQDCQFAVHGNSVDEVYANYAAVMANKAHFLQAVEQRVNPKLEDVIDMEILLRDINDNYVFNTVHHDDPALKVFCYNKNTQIDGRWTEATVATRGLVVYSEKEDLSDAVVLERPWKKFFTLQQMESGWSLGDEEAEGSADDLMASIDFNGPAEVMDKSDGSLGILYLHPDGKPALATKGSFHSDQAEYYTRLLRRNEQMYAEAQRLLKTPRSHMFEMIGPNNQIVLDYAHDDLVLLGAVERNSGLYVSQTTVPEWSGTRIETFETGTLKEALEIPDRPGREGLVIRIKSDDPKSQMKIKVKQDDYKLLHRQASGVPLKLLRKKIFESESTMSDILAVHETQSIEPIKDVAYVLKAPEIFKSEPTVFRKRREKATAAFLERATELAEAKSYVDKLGEIDFSNPQVSKEFAGKVMRELPQRKAHDALTFFNAKKKGMSIDEINPLGFLRQIAQEVKANKLGEDEDE